MGDVGEELVSGPVKFLKVLFLFHLDHELLLKHLSLGGVVPHKPYRNQHKDRIDKIGKRRQERRRPDDYIN